LDYQKKGIKMAPSKQVAAVGSNALPSIDSAQVCYLQSLSS
jgi:hypothetical protein